ncbi:MAG: ABC transporter substrate-binding protein [Caldilineaceae bacterium]
MSNQKGLSRRDFLRVSSMSVAGLALAACVAAPAAAPGGEASGGEAAPAGEKVTIRFHARIGQQEDTLYDMQMPKFMEENPDIEIVKESFPGEEYNTKVSTMLAGNTLGDAAWSALGGATINFMWAQGIVAPIDDLVASNNIDLSQWYEGCTKAITVEGNLLGLPFKSHPGLAVIYYNETAFEAAGLELPKSGWTQEQQVEAAKALTKSDATPPFYGFLPGVGNIWKTLVTLSRSFGTELLNEDGTKFQLNSELGMQAVTWLYDLFQTHKVAPTPAQMVGGGNDMWIANSLGMYQGGTSVSVTGGTIGDAFKWMVAPNAVGPGGVGGSDYEVDAYTVTTASKNPNEAFKWVQYLCSKDSGIQLGLIGGTVGGRADVYGSEELLKFPFRVVFKEIMDNAMNSRITANWRQAEAETALAQLLQPLWTGEETPTQEFIDGVAAQIQTTLDLPRP